MSSPLQPVLTSLITTTNHEAKLERKPKEEREVAEEEEERERRREREKEIILLGKIGYLSHIFVF